MSPRWLMDGEKVLEEQTALEPLTGRYTERACRFIDDSAGQPFFLYFPHTYPHIPLGASKAFRGKSPYGIYGDVLAELDWSVGEIMKRLRQHGQDRNTLFLFSSDNGPWFQGSPGHLRGRKGMTWEGGVRVPLLAWLPGRIPKGRVCHSLVSTMDVVPTVCALTGAGKPSRPLDGIDITPLLTGVRTELERDLLLYFDDVNLQCARLGKWKLHISRYNNVTYSPAPAGGRKNIRLARPELYDVVRDPDESFDVAEENPEIVKKMLGRMDELMAGFPAEIRERYDAMKTGPASPSAAGAVAR
jgi:arylsulfatase